MHVLAIGQLTTQDFQQHLAEEGAVVAEWFENGILKDVYLKADRSGPILLLNDTDAAGAERQMADLPFVIHGVATFKYVEVTDLRGPSPANNYPPHSVALPQLVPNAKSGLLSFSWVVQRPGSGGQSPECLSIARAIIASAE